MALRDATIFCGVASLGEDMVSNRLLIRSRSASLARLMLRVALGSPVLRSLTRLSLALELVMFFNWATRLGMPRTGLAARLADTVGMHSLRFS